MPTAYIKKLAKLNHTTVNKIEKFWSQAKEIAKSEGQGKAWGLITTIFQNRLKKEGYKVSAFYEPDRLDDDTQKHFDDLNCTKELTKENTPTLLAMLKHSYFKNVRYNIKQIWARSRNSEQTANQWLLTYHPLIVECEKLAIEPKVCARMCYIKYHKENPYTKHLNKNNDVSFNTLKKEALQYFEGLQKWKNSDINKQFEEFMKNEKVTASNKYSYKGKVITAESKEEAIKKIVADTYEGKAPKRLAYYIIDDLNLDLTDDNQIRIKLPNYNDAGSLIDYDFSHLGQIYKKDNDWFFTDEGRTIQIFVESDGDIVNQDKFKEALASNIKFYKDIFQRSAKKKLSWYEERLKDLQ